MTGHETRQKFLDFFASRGHRVVKSSSLVPVNDPTLLFTNAGMNQFKDIFLGMEKRDYSRAATSQKCVRAGGKHNDLENVGYTRRHHTFFEMLGNFSFGDYFKAEAIDFAWELITKDYGLDKDRLYVTVFREDDEAEELWQKVTGISKSRIFRLDEKDNFWQMGDTGPCGPCSEIHYDLGAHAAEPGHENEEFPLDGGGRFVEIWNLVFMQFDRSSSGIMTRLPKPSIDTGMGLERVAAILQGKVTNYESDLLRPIIDFGADLFDVQYGSEAKTDVVLRINADHARAAAFLIHDGVVPSNEGRGYVLRKIMRRALRNARRIGIVDPYLHRLTTFVAEFMKPAYPELLDSTDRVSRIVKDEEHRYATTYQVAERVFHDEAKRAVGGMLPGAVAFKLYDTYGLASDEQEEMAREFGLSIDAEGFEAEMDKQRERARASWKGAEKAHVAPIYQQLQSKFGRTKFTGYDGTSQDNCKVLALLVDQKEVDSVAPGTAAEVVLDTTCFYAEAGGQVGDQGELQTRSGDTIATVQTTYPAVPGLSVHKITAVAPIKKGDIVKGEVKADSRAATRRNHTATHLLHAALRSVLGVHVKQAGSVVDPARLRFDFSHYTAMSPEEVAEVERIVNEEIMRNIQVSTDVMALEDAISTGAMALFGEKYGDKVRVVNVPGFSKELCGGTHVSRTGDIGLCKIVYEGSVSAGARRLEAITGNAAVERFQGATTTLSKVAHSIKASEADLLDQIDKLLINQRNLEKQVEQLKNKIAQSQSSSMENQVRDIKGVQVLSVQVEGLDRVQMRALADSLRNKWKSAVVVLGATDTHGVALICAVTKDLTQRVHAGRLIGPLAQAVGGKGGGRPDLAEAGGKDADALPAALDAVYAQVDGLL
ncbi:MAG: alanine--tRNA ligase [Acidobacteria bacterium]|nr:alanine--tRNA ligase [Acidobacteriota bacterium]